MNKKFLISSLLCLVILFSFTFIKGDNEIIEIKLQKNNKVAYINNSPYAMDVAPIEVPPGRIMVPIRFISEGFGAKVYWDDKTETVSIYLDNVLYYKNKAITLEKEISSLKEENDNMKSQIESLNNQKNELLFQNNLLQNKIKELEVENSDLKEQIKVLNEKINELSNKEISPKTINEIFEKNRFNITIIENYDKYGKLNGFGTGFVISEDGKVITNFHVVDGASYLIVKFIDGRNYKVTELINYDVKRDLAIFKLPITSSQSVKLGDSDILKVGDEIVVIGNPAGLELTVTNGIISFTNRIIENQTWIQFSAPVSPGSSGGPVFNLKGEAIGLVTLKVAGVAYEGLNFAIPINDAKVLLKSEKRIAFNDLFGSLKSWDLTDEEILDAIKFGKSCKGFRELLNKFSLYDDFISTINCKTNITIATPYFWVAFEAYDNKEKGKDTTLKDAYKVLEAFGDLLIIIATVYGNDYNFVSYYKSYIILNNENIYPFSSDESEVGKSYNYPKSPKYYALKYFNFYNNEIPRDSIFKFILDDSFGNKETFIVNLNKYP